MALIALISCRSRLAPLSCTRAISWGPGFTREPTSTPRTVRESTSRKPDTPLQSRLKNFRQNTEEQFSNTRSSEPRAYPPRPSLRPSPTPPQYLAHRAKIKRLYPEGWSPPRTISREAMDTLREMHARDPVQFRTPVLAAKFKISPEAVSRILKSKWQPSPERKAKMIARDNKGKDMAIAERIRVERADVQKSLQGRSVLMEPSRGKES
ncbi:Required for respiratory growth protein 9 mitochondrial [Ceratobasidium sp. 392]|nr:Required for respiratory growth protein 9 mitochondrial [Ceratobasidium sp. 392]